MTDGTKPSGHPRPTGSAGSPRPSRPPPHPRAEWVGGPITPTAPAACALQPEGRGRRHRRTRPGRAPDTCGAETSTAGSDCSGFTQWAYRQAGVELPASHRTRTPAGRQISQAGHSPATWPSGPAHVAMYIGNGQLVETGGDPVGVTRCAPPARARPSGLLSCHLKMRVVTYHGDALPHL